MAKDMYGCMHTDNGVHVLSPCECTDCLPTTIQQFQKKWGTSGASMCLRDYVMKDKGKEIVSEIARDLESVLENLTDG